MVTTLDAPPPAYDESISQIDLTLTAAPSGKDILITVKPPSTPTAVSEETEKDEKKEKDQLKAKRAPVDFVLTIDVSGSMATEAPVPGENERTGLTVLDVVKHAANTIITTMKPEDRIAIVSFTGNAKVVLPLTHTDEKGKEKALQEVEALRPLDSTNLWDGLKQSMNILTGAPPASEPGSSSGAIASLLAAGNAIATGIAGSTIGTSLPRPQYGDPKHRLASIFLLTDGLPNVEPPRGHIPMLKLYLESQPKDKTKFTINTFGFGYSLDSKLLAEIAKIGNGHFGFIPDSGMVGTNFVHAVSNTYATYAEGLYLDIEVDDDKVAKDIGIMGSFELSRASWGVQVPLGQLQYGQTRDLVIQLPKPLDKSPVTVTARCRPWNSDEEIKTTRVISDADISPSDSATDPGLFYHNFRLEFVSTVHKEIASTASNSRRGYVIAYDVPDGVAQAFKDIESRIRAAFPGEKPAGASVAGDALDLAEDISGQVLLGIADKGTFNKWGLHYLLSLARSHQRQQCGNFKDPGLQSYGRDSVLFKTTRDEIDMVFDNLPPPKPSSSASGSAYPLPPPPPPGGAASYAVGASYPMAAAAAPQSARRSRAAAAPASGSSPSFSMQKYNKRSAPCFAGVSVIELSDGTKVRVEELVVGSTVKTPLGGVNVLGIIRTSSSSGTFDLCELGEGLLITPWHPVYVEEEGKWRFPADIATPKQTECNAVYSIVLEENEDSDAHAVFIGGVCCVTMGHGVVDPSDVRAHPFLANHLSIMQALKKHPDFATAGGRVDAIGTAKDIETGLMCGFIWRQDAEHSADATHEIPSVLPHSEYLAVEA
ncbi:hypothetical protein FRB90_011261 [Tulasnella sp. 427]|nr:hypothetical protein FRB90_011261 [Tulasnella sp. 427]